MGRYLDLLRDEAPAANPQRRTCDTSDISDKSHRVVDGLAQNRATGAVRSLLSLMSRPSFADARSAEAAASPALASSAALAAPPAEIADRATWSEVGEERAAIVEHDGGIPRAWAEGFARLDPNRAPGDVPSRRWLQFIDDIGRFLDDGWAERAVALGWGPLDLFGCDRERPFARIGYAGLLWLLNGDKLIEIDRHKAVVETHTGAPQTYRRKPVAVGEVVLAWELAK